MTRPPLGQWDAAAGSAAVALVVAYVVVPGSGVQYSAWSSIFCVWMAWFVSHDVRLLCTPS